MALTAVSRKVLLRNNHGAQRKIARQLGIEESRVSAVANGEDLPKTELGWKTYRRVQKAIARVLDLPVEEAFQPFERGVEAVAESAA